MNKLKRWVIASIGAVAFLVATISGVSANTNGIDVASYQGTTTSYFSQFKSYGDKLSWVDVEAVRVVIMLILKPTRKSITPTPLVCKPVVISGVSLVIQLVKRVIMRN
ncbi:hypothetical protein QMA56_08055 [Leuconostoc falkenbergense]|uniref:hypothetical protein n=1 Tax=Leuconostoc falkenbergense TaxID=2766470 RepID=UPI0024AD7B5B|nr:hypothetical protein [Leuconostoc falkenbergense]MDI6667661.1 hypothetical protein [Leuconostoc falkenbergense]